MPIPSQKDIQIPLLHLIHDKGGKVKPGDVYDRLADYFRLTEKDRKEMQPCGVSRKFDNRVAWARNSLCSQGFLDRSIHGIWKITEKGRKALSNLGLINTPFPGANNKSEKGKDPDDEELLELVLEEIAPHGPKQFPDDFLNNKDYTDFYEVELPGTQLHLAPQTQTLITSSKGYFRYQAKNPPEAKYILYAYNVGSNKVKIPSDNLALFKTVKTYEKYCDELTRRAFELFLEFTHDEDKSEELTKEATRRVQLKGKLLILGNSYG